jgi:hypothetical protein
MRPKRDENSRVEGKRLTVNTTDANSQRRSSEVESEYDTYNKRRDAIADWGWDDGDDDDDDDVVDDDDEMDGGIDKDDERRDDDGTSANDSKQQTKRLKINEYFRYGKWSVH